LSDEDEREFPSVLMLRRLRVHAYLGCRSDIDLAAEALGHFHAIDAGQHEIEDDQVRFEVLDLG